MADSGSNSMRRREFIQTGAVAAVAATALAQAESVAQDDTPGTLKPLEIPKRVLGKTGVEVTFLNGGTARSSRRTRPVAALRVQPWHPLLRHGCLV